MRPSPSSAPAERARSWLLREVYALPVDMFRVAVGLLACAYVAEQWSRFGDFSAPGGLIDHALLQRALPYTRWSLFQAGTPESLLRLALGAAGLASLGLMLGRRPKACAAVVFAVTVSLARWNFLVINIDDTVMHLALFWLLLLPIGHTLSIDGWLRDRAGCWQRWRQARVAGTAARALMLNVGLVYLTAGLWKLTSPLWRNGSALAVILNLPVARTFGLWPDAPEPLLGALNYLALAVEIALPFLLLIPTGALWRRLALACQAGFHAGIIALIGLPFANLALMGTCLLFFQEELMKRILGRARDTVPLRQDAGFQTESRLALVFLSFLVLSVTRDVPVPMPLGTQADAVLWTAGIAQEYRLFDWIDDKNWRVEHRVTAEGRELAASDFLPAGLRSALLQSYVHGVRWMGVPSAHAGELRASILARAASRLCRRHPQAGAARVESLAGRVTPHGWERPSRPEVLAEFRCERGAAGPAR